MPNKMGRPKTVTSVDILIQNYTIEDLETGCWEWSGGYHSQGYPMCRFGGKMHIAARLFFAHTHNLTLKSHERVTNECGNANCVNPDHYAISTKGSENWKKGGADYRFTQQQADELKKEWDATPYKYGNKTEFAKKHNLSSCILPKIIYGTYKSKKA